MPVRISYAYLPSPGKDALGQLADDRERLAQLRESAASSWMRRRRYRRVLRERVAYHRAALAHFDSVVQVYPYVAHVDAAYRERLVKALLEYERDYDQAGVRRTTVP